MLLPHPVAYRMWTDALERLSRDTPLCFPPSSNSLDAAAVRAFAETVIRCRRAEDLQFLSVGRKYEMTVFLRFLHALQRQFDEGASCTVRLPADVEVIRPLEILGRVALAMLNENPWRSETSSAAIGGAPGSYKATESSEPLADAG